MIIFIISIVSLTLISCSGSQSTDDSRALYDSTTSNTFYSKTTGFDYRRLPLLKPYEAMSINQKTWSIKLQLHSLRYQPSINDITQLGISGEVIVSYSKDTLLEGESVADAWFIIIPANSIERGFSDYASMTAFLGEKRKAIPDLKDADQYYKTFIDGDRLDWFPLER